MKLYIVRHGQSEWNAKHLICGSTDAPLTEKGRAQAAETAAMVGEIHKNHPIDLIIASPLQRALDTGRAIQSACGDVPLIIDERIKEIDVGESEGLPSSDQEYQNRMRQFPYVHGEGESMLRFVHRVYSFLDDIKVRYADKRVLLACHNGVARVTYSYFHSMTNEEFMTYVVKNASVTEYDL